MRIPAKISTTASLPVIDLKAAQQLLGFTFSRAEIQAIAQHEAHPDKWPPVTRKLHYSFARLLTVGFETEFKIETAPRIYALLSMAEIVPNFLVRSTQSPKGYPMGGLKLILRKDHQGSVLP